MADSAPLDTHIRAMETMISISSNIPEQLKQPKIAIVCGSGLGGLVESIHAQPRYEISYSEVPNFPTSTGMLALCLMRALSWRFDDHVLVSKC